MQLDGQLDLLHFDTCGPEGNMSVLDACACTIAQRSIGIKM